jgi:hypothetical protein
VTLKQGAVQARLDFTRCMLAACFPANTEVEALLCHGCCKGPLAAGPEASLHPEDCAAGQASCAPQRKVSSPFPLPANPLLLARRTPCLLPLL